MYVLFELGARWGAGKNLIPLVAPMSTLGGPLSGLNALRADVSAQLHQLVQDLGRQLSITPQSPAVFDRALQDVLLSPDSSSPGTEGTPASSTARLPKEAEGVLLSLAGQDGQVAEDLAESLHLSEPKVQYFLDLLEKRDFASATNYVGGPNYYHLGRDGRRYLFEHGLLT
jgi:hypothetical protein